MKQIALFITIILVVGAIAYFVVFKPQQDGEGGLFSTKGNEATNPTDFEGSEDSYNGADTELGQVKEARIYYNENGPTLLKVILKKDVPGWKLAQQGEDLYPVLDLVSSEIGTGYFNTIQTYVDGFDLPLDENLGLYFENKKQEAVNKLLGNYTGTARLQAIQKIATGTVNLSSPFVGTNKKGYLKVPEMSVARVFIPKAVI
jgi:hypothetical protein